MEIKRISRQSGRTLREFYDPASWSRTPEEAVAATTLMLAALDYLDAAEHEPVWAFTSHTMLLFTDRDDFTVWRVTLAVEREAWMDAPRFRVTYALPDPWYAALAYADDPTTAGMLVLHGLARAVEGKHRNVTFE